MKKLLIISIIALGVSACGGSDEHLSPTLINNPASASGNEDGAMASMKFDSLEKHFGTIIQGQSVVKVFTFTNVGDADLIIASAEGSCGCTVPKWPRRPISPGQKGEIEVIFKSEGKKGHQHKKIYIVANTKPRNNTLAIIGDVVAPD